jgi:pyruvate dehydrogenase E2 component (dihydrolipoamide acetyltransferase)
MVPGTGRGGRVRERDVRAAVASTSGKLIPHSRIRRVIAARMLAGVTIAAPVTLTTKVDATRLVQWREAASSKPGYTDVLVILTAKALREHPLLQAQWRDDGLFVPDHVHIAIGVDTDAGLLAPVIRDADRLAIDQIAATSRDLIDKARAGRLAAEEQRDATFTVTNLGMFGVDAFTPIIHLPQSAVLGVGRIVKEPAVVENQVVPRDMLSLSLTFDHRVVDGAPAARFLQTLAGLITRGEP